MRKRHLVFYALLRPIVVLFLKLRFGYTFEKAKNLPENYIVLSNHATDYDMLFVASSFRRQMYFVGSEHIARWKILYAFLKFAFEPIMRYKGTLASTTVKECMRKIRKGANVCMFAEGVRTWDGVTNPIAPSTAKLIKTAGCGLVTYKIVGGYFASPMWSGATVRKGYVHGAPVRVYTKEELDAMTVDEVYRVITTDLYEDAYARQLQTPKRYLGKGLAVGLERMLFICPHCHSYDSFISTDNTVSCQNCETTFGYDEYGMLSGEFQTLKAFSDWQKEQVALDVENGKTYSAAFATLRTVKNHVETPVTSGALSMTCDTLSCGEKTFLLDDIADLAMHGQRAIVFSVGKEYYELLPQEGTNSLKFYLYYQMYKAQKEMAM